MRKLSPLLSLLLMMILASYSGAQSKPDRPRSITQKSTIAPTIPISAALPLPPSTLRIDVNLIKDKGTFSKIWRGFDFTSSPDSAPQNWNAIDPSLRKQGALLLRFDPFAGNPIKMAADGSAIVNWQSADSLFMRYSESGMGLAVSISPPEAVSAEGWKQFVIKTIQRYSNSTKWNVARWELRSSASQAAVLLPAFISAVRKEAASAPVDFQLSSGSAMEGIAALADICEKNRLICDCFSWQTPNTGKLAAENIRQVRSSASKRTALKSTSLLPVFTPGVSESAALMLLQQAVQIPEIAPLNGTNPALGFLMEANQVFASNGRLLQAGMAAQLLDRISGTLVEAVTSDSSLHCLASHSRKGTSMLIWREPGGKYSAEFGASLRLHNLTPGRADGLRMSGLFGSTSAAVVKDLPPVDPQGNLSIPTIFPENSFGLLEINPHPRSPFEIKIEPVTNALKVNNLPFFYSGSTLELLASIQNVSSKAQEINVNVESLNIGLAAPDLSTHDLRVIGPGVTKVLKFKLAVPIVTQRELAGYNFRFNEQSVSSYTFCAAPAVEASLVNTRFDLSTSSEKAAFRVKLVNHSAAPISVSIDSGHGVKDSFDLPGGGKTYERRIEAGSPSSDPGLYSAPITVSSDLRKISTLQGQIAVPAVCKYARIRPVVDGDLTEWSDAVPIGLGRQEQVHEKDWGGPNDLSAYAYVQWDEKNFYFACAVTDDKAYQPFSAKEMWKGDSVQFAITTDTKGSGEREGFGPTDHFFGIAQSDSGKTLFARFAGAGSSEHIVSASKRIGTRTYYETAIPWNELVPGKPISGTTYGFSIVVNDNDGQGRGCMTWADGIYPLRRPGLFLPLRLLK